MKPRLLVYLPSFYLDGAIEHHEEGKIATTLATFSACYLDASHG